MIFHTPLLPLLLHLMEYMRNNNERLLLDIPIKLPISLPPVSVMEAHGDSETDYEIKAWKNDEISQMMFASIPPESLDKRYCEVIKNAFINDLNYIYRKTC